MMALASSFMISADNAHAVHPNHQEKADPTNRPYMNGGIVIKYNGNQKDATDAVSAAVIRSICKKAAVPYQTYANRSDIAGGSTLGNISDSHVSINTIDIGLAQLAMHSAYETAGVKDTTYMIEALMEFFNLGIKSCCHISSNAYCYQNFFENDMYGFSSSRQLVKNTLTASLYTLIFWDFLIALASFLQSANEYSI